VFPEETLVGRLQAGQLDARAFFYANEAKEAGIPTVTLGAIQLAATYTVTVLDKAPPRLGERRRSSTTCWVARGQAVSHGSRALR